MLSLAVQASGYSAVDEGMWPFHGQSEFKVFIPRKPNPNGLRAYYHCFQHMGTQRPICYYVIPDLRKPFHTPKEVMDKVDANLPDEAKVQVTADAFFTSVAMVKNAKAPVTMSLNKQRLHGLSTLFCHGLLPSEYRVYHCDGIVVCVWVDNTEVVTISNEFKVVYPDVIPPVGVNIDPVKPILSADAMNVLATKLQRDDLIALARELGVTTSGSNEEISQRICGMRYSADGASSSVDSSSQVERDGQKSATAWEEELSKLTVKALETKYGHIKKKKASNSKADYIQKLIPRLMKPATPHEMNTEVNRFIQLKKRTKEGYKPVLQQRYADHFNLVDLYDRLMSYIEYPLRVTSQNHLILNVVICLCVVNGFVDYEHKVYEENVNRERFFLKEFCNSIVRDICTKFP